MNDNNINSVIYREKQRFRQKWLMVIILIMPIFTFYAFIQQIIFKIPFGNNPAPDWLLILLLIVIGIGLPLLLYSLQLLTEVRSDGIYIRFFPLHKKYIEIKFSEIKSVQVREYHPIREYGGWGIKFGPSGKAYNVSGNQGVQLVFNSGKKLLIGSQTAEKLQNCIVERIKIRSHNK